MLTLVNIIDRVTFTARGPQAPEAMPPMTYQINLVVILKAGRARGHYELRVVPELPDGSAKASAINSLYFEGEDDRGLQIVQQAMITVTHEGLHWFNLYLKERGEAPEYLLTKLPLRVIYGRASGGISSSGG